MGQTLTSDDMLFHMLVTGGTGSGKTNAVLHMLNLLYNKKEEGKPQPALFLFDPGGDASIDLLRSIPESEWKDRRGDPRPAVRLLRFSTSSPSLRG